jgi:hypothetical protein
MSLNVVAQAKYLRELKDAYTGRTVTVRTVGTGSAQLFFSPDAFDPGSWHSDSVGLLKMLGTRDGIEGVARGSKALVCAYTGARMTIVHDPVFGFRAAGGFRPSRPCTDPFAFARGMMSRGGVAPDNAPKPARIAVSAPAEEPEEIDRLEVSESDAMQAAENILKGGMPAKVSVTVPAGAPKRRKK